MTDYPAGNLHRMTDPTTSIESAGDPKRTRATNRLKVLAAFNAPGIKELDYVRAAVICGLSESATWRRVSDLLNLGLIDVVLDDNGNEARSVLPSGRTGRVYAITAEGYEELMRHGMTWTMQPAL